MGWRVVVHASRSADSTSSGLSSLSAIAQTRARNCWLDCGQGLLGLGRRPGSLVARWWSGLARAENDPANDGLWTLKPAKDPSPGIRISPALPAHLLEDESMLLAWSMTLLAKRSA